MDGFLIIRSQKMEFMENWSDSNLSVLYEEHLESESEFYIQKKCANVTYFLKTQEIYTGILTQFLIKSLLKK